MATITQEDKVLLLKDLCARLPYGLILNVGDKDIKLDRQHQGIGILYPEDCSDEFNRRNNSAFYIIISGCYYGEDIKPYLRPMSSMTEDEQRTLDSMCDGVEMVSRLSGLKMFDKAFDWLNKNHFDFRGLIEKGLALEAPEDIYKNE